MKRTILAAAVLTGMLWATGAIAEEKVTGDVYVGGYNNYIFRGIDLSGNQWVGQGGADIALKNFTLSYWTNVQSHSTAGGLRRGEGNETDITLNYAFSPAEIVSFNVGNIFYTLDGLNDTNELYLKGTLNSLLSPTLAVYWDWDEAADEGLFFTASLGHTFTLSKPLSISIGALGSYNVKNPSASPLYRNLHNYELSISADYSVTDQIKITPSYTYSNAFNQTARKLGGVTDQNLFGIKTTLLF